MSIFDRFLLAIYSLIMTVILIISAAETAGWSPISFLLKYYNFSNAELFGALAVLIIIGIRLFWASFGSSGQKTRSGGRYVILKEGTLGQVRVSVQAVENLIIKTASKMNGVKEVKPQIISNDKGVGVRIRATVSTDLNIPETTERMQNLVKEKILEVTGVTVASVEISVESVAATKPHLE